MCAASPTSASLWAVYASAWERRRGKEATDLGSTEVITGGRGASDIGRLGREESMADSSGAVSGVGEERRASVIVVRSYSGSVQPALIMRVRASGESFFSALASSGVVLQTIVLASSERGRKASGPVGRKRWNAVWFGYSRGGA